MMLFLNLNLLLKSFFIIKRLKSSRAWLLRHFSDPYVQKARFENYRARSAFKLIEIQEKYGILKAGFKVLDCGASPGAWTQVAVKYVNANKKNSIVPQGIVYSTDLLPIQPIDGALIFPLLDFCKQQSQEKISRNIQLPLDVVLSDMAPNLTGINSIDHECSMNLALQVCNFALKNLKNNGSFLFKLFIGGKETLLLSQLKKKFKHVRIIKPEASRNESHELFILCRIFLN